MAVKEKLPKTDLNDRTIAEDKEKAKAEAKSKTKKPLNRDVSNIASGLYTSQDHELRIRIVEHKLGL